MPISTDREINFITLDALEPRAINIESGYLYGKDLSFKGEETQHSTHSLHPYVAAINPPLARELIKTYVHPGSVILDPYCGGGGVLVEAARLGRLGLGSDINPLAVYITRAKTAYISRDDILKASYQIVDRAQEIYRAKPVAENFDEQLSFWFRSTCLPKLLALKDALNEVEFQKHDLQVLFNVLFSATIRDVMLTYRGEVRLRKLTGKDLEKFKPDVFSAFDKRVSLALKNVPNLPSNCKPLVTYADVRKLPYPDNSVSAIICSPPYADDKNGVGYFQFSKNMLKFLGLSNEGIKSAKSRFLGSAKDSSEVPPSEALRLSLMYVSQRNAAHYKEAVGFYKDYYTALGEMLRVTRERVIIVIGNRVLSRTVFNNAHITVDMMQAYGANLEHCYSRSISKKRIPNLGTDGGGISTEHVLVFSK